MARLTSAQRKNLPDSAFGLPKERAFPLTDEEHVRSAIAYFYTCPPKKRKELAANINKRAKELNMKINIKKYNAFRPYADKDILTEGNIISADFWWQSELNRKQKLDWLNMTPKQNISILNAANEYLNKRYLWDNRPDTTKISDYIYDKDIENCRLGNLANVYNKNLIIDLLDYINHETDEMIDCVNKEIDLMKLPMEDDYWTLNTINDFGILARPNMSSGITDEEIYNFVYYQELIEDMCNLARKILITKYNFPYINHIYLCASEIMEMHRRGIISGYYISGDNDDINKINMYKNCVKFANTIFVPFYLYKTSEESTTVMIKMFDDTDYFMKTADSFIRSRKKILPKMRVKKITIINSDHKLIESFNGIDLSDLI